MKNALLIIDPQVDFTVPDVGALVVNGANEDMARLAAFIDENQAHIDRIFVTMDSHSKIAIFHPIFWVDKDGNRPAPFTAITTEDLENGVWQAKHAEMQEIAVNYLEQLKQNNRFYPLVVWPEHCLVGTHGWSVHPELMQALLRWEDSEFATVDYIVKGNSPFTEMYSAIRADVIDHTDPRTDINWEFLHELWSYDNVLVAGEALSHCVANTVTDIVGYCANPKLTLLTDAMSNVAGFEKQGQDFLDKMKGIVNLSTTSDYEFVTESIEQ